MRDDKDFCEIMFDKVNGFDQSLTPLSILRTEAFVYDKCLQARAFALRENFREREANCKINSECLTT